MSKPTNLAHCLQKKLGLKEEEEYSNAIFRFLGNIEMLERIEIKRNIGYRLPFADVF